jgi:hypothetical protein
MEEVPATPADIHRLLEKFAKIQRTHGETLGALAELGEVHGRQIAAHQRLVVALASLGVEHAADRLAFTDELRRLALEPHKQADDPADPSRDLIEMYLAKVETYAVALGRAK